MNSWQLVLAKQRYGVEMVLNYDTGLEEIEIPYPEALRQAGIRFIP
jgi:hypothetical protein